MKKICVVTGGRAEYGLLRWVMDGIHHSTKLDLQLAVTGMHLSPEFGLTVDAIEADGFTVDRKIEMLLSSDTAVGVTKSMGLGIIGFADALADLKPDLMLVLGDRYEIFAAAVSGLIARIPIAHLHGGESSEGVIDESIRHSITKLSHLHFVATETYRRRVIQLGEQPNRVFTVGGLGVDSITRLQLMSRKQLENSLEIKLQKRNLLITYHPITLEQNTSASQMNELLMALSSLEDIGLVFTMPNADTDGRILFQQIGEFCLNHKNAKVFRSLGQLRYFSCLNHFDGVVGNSSSGLTEAPSFKKGTINIGDRQRGRLKAISVIDCQANEAAITQALQKLFSPAFQSALKTVENPYGNGGASAEIVRVIEEFPLSELLKKQFFNWPSS